MKRIVTRPRVLVVLLLAAGLYAAMEYSGTGQPRPAQAVQANPVPSSAGAMSLDEARQLVDALGRNGHVPISDELEGLSRDLFQPTPIVQAALGLTDPETEAPGRPAFSGPGTPLGTTGSHAPGRAKANGSSEVETAPEIEFCARHRLVGVSLGRRPMAVIDDRVLALNAELDGYTLIEVARDYVIFQQTGGQPRVKLDLQQRPVTR